MDETRPPDRPPDPRIGGPLTRMLGGVFGDPINMAHWNQNDPLILARRNQAALHHLAIYFNCGDQDEFGFEVGAKALHERLVKESVAHEYHIYPGHHDATYFLAHLGEAVVFHSRLFEKAQAK